MSRAGMLHRSFHSAIILIAMVAWCIVAPVRADGSELKIITELAPPASYVDADGNLTGLAVEIVRAIQQEVGDTTEIKVMPWARGYQELGTTPDVALFSTTRTEAREPLFQWVGPLFTTHWVIYALKERGLHLSSLEEAKPLKRIGVYRDDARAQLLRDNGFENLDIADRQELNIVKLLGGRVDAILYSDLCLKEYLAKSGTAPDLIEAIFELGARDLYIAFSLGSNPQTVRVWQEAVDRLEKRGDLKRIRDKWLP